MSSRGLSNSCLRFPLAGAACLIALAAPGFGQASGSPPGRGGGDSRAEPPILVGVLTRADLRKPPFAEWFDRQYSQYEPAADAVDGLRARLASISIEVYFGTWCGDSRRQVPRLMRLLDLAGFGEERFRLVGLSDRPMEFKKSPGNPEAGRRVHRTPTIVVLRDGAEIGRIVETPSMSLEADLLAILEGRGPEPKYGAEAFVHRLLSDLPPAEAEKTLQSTLQEISKRGDPGSLWHYAEYDLLRNGRAREAKAVLDLHLELDPQSVIGYILLGEALSALELKKEAEEAIQRALAIEPGNRRALLAAEALRRP